MHCYIATFGKPAKVFENFLGKQDGRPQLWTVTELGLSTFSAESLASFFSHKNSKHSSNVYQCRHVTEKTGRIMFEVELTHVDLNIPFYIFSLFFLTHYFGNFPNKGKFMKA